MGGRVYTTTTIYVMGTKVEVRQPLFKGVNRVPEQVGKLVKQAKTWVPMTICDVNQEGFMRDAQNDRGLVSVNGMAFRTCFLQNPSHHLLRLLSSRLEATNAGLIRKLAIKVRPMSRVHGSVKVYYPMNQTAASFSRRRFGKCSRSDGVSLYDKDGDIIHSLGEIHLDLDSIWDQALGTLTLIHEATHKFANTEDFAYFKSDLSGYELKRNGQPITAQETLDNADSYATFVTLNVDKKKAERVIRRADNATINELEGVAGLFS